MILMIQELLKLFGNDANTCIFYPTYQICELRKDQEAFFFYRIYDRGRDIDGG